MEILTTELQLDGKNLKGFDFKAKEEYIGITKTNEIISPHSNFELQLNIKNPLLRLVEEGLFLLISPRTRQGVSNGFIYDLEGNLKTKLYLGDGIEDVIIIRDKIIVSYFDEGILGDRGPNNNGLSIFNLRGELEFGFNEKHGNIAIMDCYCMSKIDNQRIIFSAYTNFNLVELNINSYKETNYEIPLLLKGSVSMTSYKNKLYFYSPYKDKEGIYEWELGTSSETVIKLGNYKGHLRGLENGRFLTFMNKSYTLIELS